ncbi:hypothetical protein [Rhizobium sp. BK376]|uniref:hypothetical protein n=1 Tax=Rhizobium sp. BK376 TaxID=2512149 RepID=UPI0010446143|nr:hypothetical protein [Rhizobium sp. BK376]TCR75584.1 hypothetical protein EV561_12223 [Rhizobium sp. BK376]
MLRGKRDSFGGPPGHPIPSMDEVGGRILVLRVVAIAALARLLKRYDEKGKAELTAAFRRAIKRKCGQANLTEGDTAAALDYARELFDEALTRASAPQSSGSH